MVGWFLWELTTLRQCALTAVHRAVTAAAQKLHPTQPAVTLQIPNWQTPADLPLLQRSSGCMLQTNAGREVLVALRAYAGRNRGLHNLAGNDDGQDRRPDIDRHRKTKR